MKTEQSLRQKITDFDTFCNFLKKWSDKSIIDTGRLAEWYCSILFNLELSSKSNELFDAIDKRTKKKVEIKQRYLYRDSLKTPAGMKINLTIIDYVLLVALDKKTLLPLKIIRIDKKVITPLKNGRVSFKNAYNNKILR